MDFIKKPMEIENRSMEIIAPYLEKLNLSEAETKVYSRIIHAAGDVEYAPIIRIHPEAIEMAQKALKNGADIYTDVEMVRTGINKRKLASFGGEVFCKVADPEIAAIAKEQGNVIKLEHNQFVSINRSAAVELRITLECFGTEHKRQIMKALEKAQFKPKQVRTSL